MNILPYIIHISPNEDVVATGQRQFVFGIVIEGLLKGIVRIPDGVRA
jgi:hypothetical protein